MSNSERIEELDWWLYRWIETSALNRRMRKMMHSHRKDIEERDHNHSLWNIYQLKELVDMSPLKKSQRKMARNCLENLEAIFLEIINAPVQ